MKRQYKASRRTRRPPRPGKRGGVLRRQALWLALLLFGLALLPRVLAPGDFWTTDEARHWSQRAERFLQAVQQGEWAATNQTGHPGVTTMWLGAIGSSVYRWQAAPDQTEPIEPIERAAQLVEQGDYGGAAAVYSAHQADFARYRYLLRLPVALVVALWVPLMYLLLLRLVASQTALLAGLFFAADPFLLAHSKVLHLDALLTVLLSLSLLAAIAAFFAEPALLTGRKRPARMPPLHYPLLVLSAAAGGLALLTKSPAILLPPLVGLVALAALSTYRRRKPALLPGLLWRAVVVPLLVWGGVAVLVCFVLWPALWVAPVGTVQGIIQEASENGGMPHPDGSFFLGRPVSDPGGLFYPVALVLRLSPWVLPGLLVAALLPPKKTDQSNRALVLLTVAVLLFLLLLSLSPKKFDRYMLPVFPLLHIVAAVGWMRAWSKILPGFGTVRTRSHTSAKLWRNRLLPLAPGLLLLLDAAWYHPYQLAYYNPLFGGGSTASRVMLVGWGEGLAQAGDYISAQPDGCDHAIAAWYQEAILPFVCTAVMNLGWANNPQTVNYAVLYINQRQRQLYADITASLPDRGSLVHTVTIHGIDYAHVYHLPRPTRTSIAAEFGGQIRLTGYTLAAEDALTSRVLRLTTTWQALPPLAATNTDYLLFLHLLDSDGQRVAQADIPPAGPALPTSTWRTGHYSTWEHPLRLAPGSNLSPGRYWLAVGLYNPATGQRLPVGGSFPAFARAPDYGPDALLLAPVELRR